MSAKKRTVPRDWTKTDVKRLRSFARRGVSAREAGQHLGRTRGAVAFKAMVLGVRFRAINQPRGVQKRIARRRRR